MKFEDTHPWIRFELAVDPRDFRFWLRMGEIASNCEHLSGAPLRPEVAAELNKVFLAKGALATTAIEGNTLTEEQVRAQVDGVLEVPPSQAYLKREVENIIDLYNEEIDAQLRQVESGGAPRLSRALIESYNERILSGLDEVLEDGVIPGRLRTDSVIVGNVYRGAPAEDCGFLLDKLCQWLNGPDFDPPEGEVDLKVPFAVIKAAVAHVYLAWIHPFGDGNGRTARLVEFHVLFSNGVPLPAAHLLSDHYNRTRARYYRELDRSSKSGGELMPFLNYAVQGLLDGLREQVNEVRQEQMKTAWENLVHDRFGEKKPTPTQKRRRDLVLELSRHPDPVRSGEIDTLSPKLAKAYALAGGRMVQRDLNALAQMGLVDRTRGSVLARRHMVAAFLPPRVKRPDEANAAG